MGAIADSLTESFTDPLTDSFTDSLKGAIIAGAVVNVAESKSVVGMAIVVELSGNGSEVNGAVVARGRDGAIAPTGVTSGDRNTRSVGTGDAVANANSVRPAESLSRLL